MFNFSLSLFMYSSEIEMKCDVKSYSSAMSISSKGVCGRSGLSTDTPKLIIIAKSGNSIKR